MTRRLRPAQPLDVRLRLLLPAGVAMLAISPVVLALIPALLALALGPGHLSRREKDPGISNPLIY